MEKVFNNYKVTITMDLEEFAWMTHDLEEVSNSMAKVYYEGIARLDEEIITKPLSTDKRIKLLKEYHKAANLLMSIIEDLENRQL